VGLIYTQVDGFETGVLYRNIFIPVQSYIFKRKFSYLLFGMNSFYTLRRRVLSFFLLLT